MCTCNNTTSDGNGTVKYRIMDSIGGNFAEASKYVPLGEKTYRKFLEGNFTI